MTETKMGRPGLPGKQMAQIVLTKPLIERLDAEAIHSADSRSSLIRRAVCEYLNRAERQRQPRAR